MVKFVMCWLAWPVAYLR